LNSHGHLVKPQDFPFDFQIQPARFLATLEVTDRISQRLPPP
jgi:hypothetical protein